MGGVVGVDCGCVVEEAEGDVAGSACYVEHFLRGLRLGLGLGLWGTGVQGTDEAVFPKAVDAQGHVVVHGVVGRGDGGEDGFDWWNLGVSGVVT